MKRYLVVTGDDFGFSAERNKGIMEAFHNGAIKSASILLNCTGTLEGVSLFKSSNLCPGLHLNLTEGKPVGEKQYETLTTSEGIFRGKFGLREGLTSGKIASHELQKKSKLGFVFQRWPLLDYGFSLYKRLVAFAMAHHSGVPCSYKDCKIKEEIEAQIQKYKELFGSAPVYVDGHQHIHIEPAVVDIFAEALNQHNIQITRYPVEINMASKSWVNPEYVPLFFDMIAKAEKTKVVLDKHNIRTTDSFAGLSTMGADMTLERLKLIILEAFTGAERRIASKPPDEQLDSVTCELMTHPGYPTGQDYGGFCWGSDDFGCSEDRVHEIRLLSSKELMEFYKDNNIELVSHQILLK